METDVQNNAAPSAATETPNPYASGKMTREISRDFFAKHDPEAPPKIAEPAAADKSKETDAPKETKSEPLSKSAPDPESGKGNKQETRRKPGAEDRIGELTGQVKAKDAELETARKRIAELEKAGQTSKPAEPSAAKAPEPQGLKKPEKPAKPTKPDSEAFKTYEEFQAAEKQYDKDLAAWEEKFEQYLEAKGEYEYQTRLQKESAERNQKQQHEFVNAQIEVAKKAYPDWETVANPAMAALWGDGKPETGAHPAVKHALGISTVMPHLVYVLGGDKELTKFVSDSRQDPVKAIMKLGAMEALLIPELEKASKETSKSTKEEPGEKTEVNKDPPAKPKTEEPKETKEVGGRGTGPNDPSADAARRGSFHAFDMAQRAKMAKRFQG